MELATYIRQRGEDDCAKAWGVSRRAVASWRFGERYPRPEQAQAIVKETNGAVSMDDIYGAREKASL
ncbi:MAG: hypothetical protein KDH16_20955 [Rhodocyclaceae bacterium]|nr:hypothetical protein [Rhodocyclaceae bacterium]